MQLTKPTENKGKQIAHICIWLGYLQTEIKIQKSLDVFIDMTINEIHILNVNCFPKYCNQNNSCLIKFWSK